MKENQFLGRRIQRKREQMGLSLRMLADQTGVTASFLSQIERGQTNPSLNSLQTIAKALKVPIFHLLLEESFDSHLVRNGQGPRLALSESNIEYEMRSPGPGRHRRILAFVAYCQPGYDHEAVPSTRPTEECIYVVEGCLRVELETASHEIEMGDSLTFDGMTLRRLATVGDRATVYLSFSTPPFV